MAIPLVRTKFFVPRLRRGLVARSRLSIRLDAGAEAKVLLVSAPAGFGKTTAVVAWLEQAPKHSSVAWLSLDEGDRQAPVFWTYLVTALEAAAPGVSDDLIDMMQSLNAPMPSLLATMLNALGELTEDLYLVLDDYHLVDGPGIDEGMAYLLEHLPPRVHIVLITRADPGLPLARLRARGDLVEIRAADLRFTPVEVSAFFQATGLALTGSQIASLEARTEGWVAALQLAALSMQGMPDIPRFIQGFAGDNRYVVDYLVEEVLARQAEEVRTFLLQTSVLDRLSGDLCDAVTGRTGGREMLETVSHANLFLVRLDDTGTWFRYHHLFADVLRAHLRDERPEQFRDLHAGASRWYEREGEALPAVRHALLAGDVERAAGLAELAAPGLLRDRHEAIVRGWLDVIPDKLVRARPVLAIGFIGALMLSGEFEGVPTRLAEVEHWLRPGPVGGAAPGMVVADRAELQRLPGLVEQYRAALALIGGDRAATHSHARRAIERAAPDDHLTRAGASVLSGLASWGAGDLGRALDAYAAGMEGLRRAGNTSDVLGCAIAIADIQITQGRLSEALATFRQGIAWASHGPGVVRGTPDMHVGISQVLLERDDVGGAMQSIERCQELGEHLGLPQNPYRWRRALAQVRARQGNFDAAIQLVEQAEAVHFGDFSPNATPLRALKARFQCVRGDVGSAWQWAREQGITAADELSYLHEYEHITLARVLLSRFTTQDDRASLQAAAELLGRLRLAAEEGGRTGSVIEILVLQSLAGQYARGGREEALAPLELALMLAEPEGYVRVFVAEGPSMGALLQRLAKAKPNWAYLRSLIGAYLTQPKYAGDDRAGRGSTQGLIDPLSGRELEVLRLLSSDLDGPGLARHLVVSLNTVRTHTRNIYAKLGVSSRQAAVRRAAELDLFGGSRDS